MAEDDALRRGSPRTADHALSTPDRGRVAEPEVENPTAELTFVIGPDNFFNFAKFYNAEEIVRRWSVMACPEKVAIRSTDIRTLLADGKKINHLTTPNVCAMLVENNYY